MTTSATEVAKYWDAIYKQTSSSQEVNDKVLIEALKHFGCIEGKSLLDLGCGTGLSSLYFASKNAFVTGVDISQKAIDDLTILCKDKEIININPVRSTVLDLKVSKPVDFVFGSMILHHIEPFDEFVRWLRMSLKPHGKAFFYENNANSRILMWFRDNIAGNYWVPKNSDEEEYPLTPNEIEKLRSDFSVEIVYPELLFFRLLSPYLLNCHFGPQLTALDEFFYRRRWLLKYSYRQYVLIKPIK